MHCTCNIRTMPVIVAEVEGSFNVLEIIENTFRTTIYQNLLNSLVTLSIEACLIREINFDLVIQMFTTNYN